MIFKYTDGKTRLELPEDDDETLKQIEVLRGLLDVIEDEITRKRKVVEKWDAAVLFIELSHMARFVEEINGGAANGL